MGERSFLGDGHLFNHNAPIISLKMTSLFFLFSLPRSSLKKTLLFAPQKLLQDPSSCLSAIRCKSTSINRDLVPRLVEDELEERFTKGSGPGGQNVNKMSNAVFLKHLPTGLWVKCHQQRSLEMNRKIARKLLITKLDNLVNGEDSVENQEKILAREKLEKKKKTKAKYAARAAEKAQNSDSDLQEKVTEDSVREKEEPLQGSTDENLKTRVD